MFSETELQPLSLHIIPVGGVIVFVSLSLFLLLLSVALSFLPLQTVPT